MRLSRTRNWTRRTKSGRFIGLVRLAAFYDEQSYGHTSIACYLCTCQPTTNGVGDVKNMVTKLLKVVAQTEAVYVPSRKAEGGQLAKSMIRLKELGGEYEDEYICAMFGNLALCKFSVGKTVIASLRFLTHESNGSYFQDVVASDVQNI